MIKDYLIILNDPYYLFFPFSIVFAIVFSFFLKKAKNIAIRNFLHRINDFVNFWLDGDVFLFLVIILALIVLIFFG